MATTQVTAAIVSPPSLGASSGTTGSYSYYRVGHNSGATNVDSVWKFTTPSGGATTTAIAWAFSWNNTAAGTGWSGNFTYAFTLSTSSASGTLVSGIKTVTANCSGASGTVTVNFTGLKLLPNKTYYLRANYSNATSKSTMKAAAASQSITCTSVVPTLVRSTAADYSSRNTSYTILAEVSNAVNVYIPTWTLNDAGQDDIEWRELYHYTKMGLSSPWNVNGQTYSYGREVFRSDHNNEFGTYISQIYANYGSGAAKYLGRAYYAYYTQTLHFKDSSDPTGNDIATSRTINWGDTLGTLPTPTKTGYDLVGWSTTEDGSSPVTASTQLYKAAGFELINTVETQPPCNLYAQWKLSGSRRRFINGEWKRALRYRRVNGEWKRAIRYKFTDGEWKVST